MDARIRNLLHQIRDLEEELSTALHEREAHVLFTVRGRRIEFESDVREMHQRLKRNFFHWVTTDRPQNFLTGPFIYGMALPLALLDLCITLYQWACFSIYGIAKVQRADYIVFDRHHLGYLNFVERFHCEYCAYANGLIAYAGEIVARTEQYFCPIKHARKVLGAHRHTAEFLEYGDSTDFHVRLEQRRDSLAQVPAEAAPPPQRPA